MAAEGARWTRSVHWEGREQRAALLLLLLLPALAAWTSLEPEALEEEDEKSQVQELSGANWSLLLQGHWMVEFYAPWCPACQQMELVWEAFARDGEDLELNVSKVDVTQEPGVSGRFFVTTLPTIYHAKDGIFRRYRGSRSLEDLEGYILEKKWEAVEPVAGWKSPSSILMHGMAGLFHLSGWIRQIHNYLTGTLGLHIWCSYAVFILATLLIGLILGLILVLLSDCISPLKSKTEVSDLMVPSDDKIEEQQESLQSAAGETVTEKGLPEGDDEEGGEEESQENSSDDSAVEGSQTEDELEHQESDKIEQSSVRQRKNQVDAAGL
ncbi:thioredoxin-related transmembrane protein 4 [Sceloporus undulatus]|uniref:thioredoxin-related transmembrane protein 4 n=1 Tax=Sceloporus undulatus TaxID=8520 RepID=UPI001C4DBEC7|nr:thioredoxin-related transmembrane protein 4 [Sceloporus undulatus]